MLNLVQKGREPVSLAANTPIEDSRAPTTEDTHSTQPSQTPIAVVRSLKFRRITICGMELLVCERLQLLGR